MIITVAERLRPFSHRPGTCCLIPGAETMVEVFPALVRFYTVERELIREERVAVQGPVKEFTVMQDLERGVVSVWGRGVDRFFRYHILPSGEIVEEKRARAASQIEERLSLGTHKKQEWEKIKEREDFCEIFPLWYALGIPLKISSDVTGPMGDLVDACRSQKSLASFRKLFRAGFEGMLVPRLYDSEYQGILPEQASSSGNPLCLLSEGAQIIRSLFVEEEKELAILPHLPPEFHAGRIVNVATSWGELDLEWSKKTIRRVVLRSSKEGILPLRFSSSLKRFRLRHHRSEKGESHSCGTPLEIKSKSLYVLDRFQK